MSAKAGCWRWRCWCHFSLLDYCTSEGFFPFNRILPWSWTPNNQKRKASCGELKSWWVQEMIYLPARNKIFPSRTEPWFHPFPCWGVKCLQALHSCRAYGQRAPQPRPRCPSTAPVQPQHQPAGAGVGRKPSRCSAFGGTWILTCSSSPAELNQHVIDSCLVQETICCSDRWLKGLPGPSRGRRANRFEYWAPGGLCWHEAVCNGHQNC